MIRSGARRTLAALALLLGVGGLALAAPAPAAGPSQSPSLQPGSEDEETVRRQAVLMGTRVSLTTIAVDRRTGLQTLERLLAALEDVEAELSTWNQDSLLSAINRQPVGIPHAADKTLCSLLEELKGWHERTAGAFDPAVGSLIEAWGLRRGGRVPGADDLRRARSTSGLAHLRVQRRPCRITRLRDVLLDAGAFGKGVAIDRAVRRSPPEVGPWIVDLGGQVGVGGSAERPWPVALSHPIRREEVALELSLTSGSLATSGGSERDTVVGGHRIGHLLDPRTGRPISRRESVVVWHRRGLVADLVSTALFVMGPEEGLAWAEENGIAACFLAPGDETREVELRATSAFRRRFL